MTFAPTAEQQACIDAAITGKSTVIEAGAGSGKTSTLRLIAEAVAPRRLLYLAYNKAIQTDAERSFPDNVTCKTAHSVAYGWMMRSEHKGLMAKLNRNVKPWEAAGTLGIPSAGFQGSERHIGQRGVASLVATTISRFCNSASESVTGYHVPREFDGDDQAQFEAFVLPFARKAWADITSTNGALKFTHDHYLKLWSLACPELRFDGILFDEAQDANPCIAHVVENQPATTQVIMVGDSAQAIYGWRGAVDAMANFKCEYRLTLSQSFRFGQAVADVANIFLNLLDAPLRLTGFEAIASTVEPLIDADAILCRTNAAVIEYAMQSQASGKAVAIVGGTKEIEAFAKNADKLITGKGMVTHPDLAGFDSWADVRTFSQQDDGRDLRVMVRLVDDYGVAAILNVCENSVNEDQAEVIVSTAHKAKGREWDRVRIAADFKRSDDGELPPRAELMLMYVACTRAKLALDHGALAFVAT